MRGLGLRSRDEEPVGAALARLLHAEKAVFTDSGTAALTLALRSVRPKGHRSTALVGLPAYSCYDLATAALGAGVDVVFFDIDPGTLGPDETSLRASLRHQPDALVLAPLFGFPVDVHAVRALPEAAGLTIIEDVAQALGASWAGAPAGSLGDLTVLSFGRGKGVTTGRGGALLARGTAVIPDDAIPRRAGTHLVGDLGVLAAQWVFGRPSLFWIPFHVPFLRLGETVFHPPLPPERASRLVAPTLAVTLPLNEREVEGRRRLAARLDAAVQEAPAIAPVSRPTQSLPSFLRYPIRCSGGALAAAAESRALRLGIARGYPQPLPALSEIGARCRNAGARFPGAEALARELVTLPTHRWVGGRDAGRLERWIHDVGHRR